MPIEGIGQPDFLEAGEGLRLRRYNGEADFALPWYQDPETVWLVDGRREIYDRKRLYRMYDYLDRYGELYFIESFAGGRYQPIGDVTLMRDDLPIVIGDPRYRGKGIGKLTVGCLIRRARELALDHLAVREIYRYNEASAKLFLSCGFVRSQKTERGNGYYLALK